VEAVRKDIGLKMISADVMDPRSGIRFGHHRV